MTTSKKIALVLIGLSFAFATQAAKPVVNVGDVPPDYLGKDGDSKKINLSDYRGKIVVVSFFATWCGPCRKEVPILASLQKKAGRDKLIVIAIDKQEDRNVVREVRRTFKDYEITFTHDENGAISQRFGVEGIPHMVIVGANGKVAAKHVGYGEGSVNVVVNDINRVWRESRSQPAAEAQ